MNSSDIFSKPAEGGNNLIKILIIVIAVALIAAVGFLVLILQRNNNTTDNTVTSYPVINPGTSYPVSIPLLSDSPVLENNKTFRLANTDFIGVFDKDMRIVETGSKVTITGEGFTLTFEVTNQAAPKAIEKSPLIISSAAFGSVIQFKESDSVYKYSNDMNLNLGLNCTASGKTIEAPCGVPQVKLNDKYLNVTCSGSGQSLLVNCNTLMSTIALKPIIK